MIRSRSFLALVVLVTAAAAQRTFYVDANNPRCPGSGTRTDPFCRIQDGVAAAQSGDTVLVADGTYRGQISLDGRNLTLRSERGPGHCTIDAQGTVALWFVAFETTAVIDGFTVTNGSGSSGGALFCHHDATPTFRNCVFSGNRASSGGAVYCDTASAPTFVECVFRDNAATCGGAVYLATARTATPVFVNCMFSNNSATSNGGALCASGVSNAAVLDCTLVANSAAGSGGGISVEALAAVLVTNSILWDNRSDQISGPATVTFSDVQGGFAGAGNIDLDPRFVDAPGLDFHLRATSPCIDAGSAAGGLPPFDFEGDPRAAFGRVDIGADEHFQHLYHTGVAAPGRTIRVTFVGRPQEPAFWILAASTLDPGLAIPGLNGRLRLDPRSLVVLPAGGLSQDGVALLPVTIPTNFRAGRVPAQALIGTQFTNLDTIVVG